MEIRNYINGQFIESISNKKIDVINPADQSIVDSIDEALDEEIDIAFRAATNAFEMRVIQDMDPKDKSRMMRSIASKLRTYKIEGSKILSKENGKTVEQCVENLMALLIHLITMLG